MFKKHGVIYKVNKAIPYLLGFFLIKYFLLINQNGLFFLPEYNKDELSDFTLHFVEFFPYLFIFWSFYKIFLLTSDLYKKVDDYKFDFNNIMKYLAIGCLYIVCFHAFYFSVYYFGEEISLLLLSLEEHFNYKALVFTSVTAYFFIISSKIITKIIVLNDNNLESVGDLTPALQDSSLRIVSDKYFENTAVHEVGHLMIAVMFKDYIKDITLCVKKRLVSSDTMTGYVRYTTNDKNLRKDKNFLYYEMMLYLAGNISEEIYYGTGSIGSGIDNTMWFEIAKKYLSLVSNSNNIYYPRPKNKLELESNNEILAKLRAEQVDKVERLLRDPLNRAVFHEIVDYIKNNIGDNDSITIEHNELMPYIERIYPF